MSPRVGDFHKAKVGILAAVTDGHAATRAWVHSIKSRVPVISDWGRDFLPACIQPDGHYNRWTLLYDPTTKQWDLLCDAEDAKSHVAAALAAIERNEA